MLFFGTENNFAVKNVKLGVGGTRRNWKLPTFFFTFPTLLSIFLIVLISSCSPKNPARTSDSNTQPRPIPPQSEVTAKSPEKDVTPPPPPPPLPYVVMHLEKSACFGHCPMFELKLFSDGRAEYHGKAYTQRLGVYESRVTKAFIDLILHEAEKINYFQLNDHYPIDGQFISDLPNTTTYIKKSGREKTIIRNHNGPLTLRKYETFLIERFDALRWEPLSYK